MVKPSISRAVTPKRGVSVGSPKMVGTFRSFPLIRRKTWPPGLTSKRPQGADLRTCLRPACASHADRQPPLAGARVTSLPATPPTGQDGPRLSERAPRMEPERPPIVEFPLTPRPAADTVPAVGRMWAPPPGGALLMRAPATPDRSASRPPAHRRFPPSYSLFAVRPGYTKASRGDRVGRHGLGRIGEVT